MQAIVDLNDFSQGDIGFHQEIIQVSVAYPLINVLALMPRDVSSRSL